MSEELVMLHSWTEFCIIVVEACQVIGNIGAMYQFLTDNFLIWHLHCILAVDNAVRPRGFTSHCGTRGSVTDRSSS